MRDLLAEWKKDKLLGTLQISFLLAAATSFWNDVIVSWTIPGAGAIFPFRIFLPLAAALYLLWALREKDLPWRGASAVERWCYGFSAILLLYGAVSLLWAIDFAFSFRKLFNLAFALVFFCLMLRLCRDNRLFRATMWVCGVSVALLCAAGVYEVFWGGIWNPGYDNFLRFEFFQGIYQFPIVTYANTNDYTAALCMCAAVLLLCAARNWDRLRRGGRWAIAALLSVLYFLTQAATARLGIVAVGVLLAGFTLFLLLRDRRRLWITAAVLLAVLFVEFASNYLYIVPPIKQYLAELEEYRQSQAMGNEATPPPKLDISRPSQPSLSEEFFEEDEETGEMVLRSENSSGGERTLLILHAFGCFKESRGLGVGLGNTEKLAGERKVAMGGKVTAIHCFVARIIGDYGLFALIPLCVIALLLLRKIWKFLCQARREKDLDSAAYGLFFLFVLLMFPFSSTAPADAQDIIAMWIYLAAIVLISGLLPVAAGSVAPQIQQQLEKG